MCQAVHPLHKIFKMIITFIAGILLMEIVKKPKYNLERTYLISPQVSIHNHELIGRIKGRTLTTLQVPSWSLSLYG